MRLPGTFPIWGLPILFRVFVFDCRRRLSFTNVYGFRFAVILQSILRADREAVKIKMEIIDFVRRIIIASYFACVSTFVNSEWSATVINLGLFFQKNRIQSRLLPFYVVSFSYSCNLFLKLLKV